MCLLGSKSATHSSASPLSEDIIDLSTAEGRVPANDDWTVYWLLYMLLSLVFVFFFLTQAVCMCPYAVVYVDIV